MYTYKREGRRVCSHDFRGNGAPAHCMTILTFQQYVHDFISQSLTLYEVLAIVQWGAVGGEEIVHS